MSARNQVARSSVTGNRPPTTRPVGEFYVNFADNQLGVTDPTPAPRDLLPVRYHAATAAYVTNDIVRQGTGLYQAKANIPAHAFNAVEWDQFLTTLQGDARWLPLTGGTLTGLLTLSGAPVSNLHAATKQYADTKLPLAGGTLTGPLALSGDPSLPLHAATKQYTDTRLALAGGTMTGALTLSGPPVSNLHAATKAYVDTAPYLKLTGGTLTGLLTLSGPPTAALHAATKAYVDGVAGNYLPLTGGTVSGSITAAGFGLGNSGATWYSDANQTYFIQDGSNWRWQYSRSTGQMTYVRGSDSASLFWIDPSGNISSAGGLIAGGSITATTGFAMNQAGANGTWIADSNNVYLRFSGAWGFLWSRSTGRLYFENNSGTPLISFDPSGKGIIYDTFDGTAHAFVWDGYGQYIYVGGSNAGYSIRSPSGGGLTGVYQIALNGSASQVYAYYGTGTVVQWTYSPSDRRLKQNIEPSTFDALGALNQLQVRSFDLTVPIPDAVSMHWDCGLVADEVKQVMPVAYVPATEPGAYEMIRELPLIAALVRGMQQLDQRVRELEGP